MAKGTSGAIRAGRAYVELFSDGSKLNAGLKQGLAKLKAFGTSVASVGRQMLIASSVAAVPFALSAKTAADFEQSLADMRAAANLTAAELQSVRDKALAVAEAMGMVPTDVVVAFTELTKAGVSVEQVLNGAGEAALRFARVGALEAGDAVKTLTSAVNVFNKEGMTFSRAADIISAAADASTISIKNFVDAFQQGGANAGLGDQTLRDFAAAVALMGKAGVAGSDAGTSLKTFMSRIAMGADGAGEKLKALGVEVYGANGRVRPLVEIIGELETAMAGMSREARNNTIYDIFGSDAQRAAAILLDAGSKGFAAFLEEMDRTLPVAAKFKIMLNTVSGDVSKLEAKLAAFAIEVGTAIFSSLRSVLQAVTGVINAVSQWVKRNREVVQTAAKIVAVGFAIGGALLAAGVAIKIAAVGIGILGTTFGLIIKLFLAGKIAVMAIASPLGLVIVAIAAAGAALLYWTGLGGKALSWLMGTFAQMQAAVEEVVGGIVAALQKGDIAAAANIAWLALKLVWKLGVGELMQIWIRFRTGFDKLVASGLAGVLRLWNDLSFGIRAIWTQLQSFVVSTWEKTVNAVSQALLRTGILIDKDTLKRQAQMAQKAIDESTKLAQEARAKGDNAGAARHERNAEQARQRLAEADPANAIGAELRRMQAESDAAIKDIEAKRRAALDKLADDHTRTMRQIDDDLKAAGKGLDEQAGREVAEARRALEAARDELRKAIADAKKPTQKGSAGRDKSGKSDISRFFEEARAKEALANGGAAASGSIARGTFNSAAIQSLQGGGREQLKVAKEQLKVQSQSLTVWQRIASGGVPVKVAYGA